MAIKTSLGLAGFVADPTELHGALLDKGFTGLGISPKYLARMARLPWLHRAPFDRLLVAQTQEEGLTLLTADAALKGYGHFGRAV